MDLRAEFMVDEEIDMSPMIDMVFLLIIFFMVASHMTKMDNPEIKMPIAQDSVVPEAEQLADRRSITVQKQDKKYQIYLGNLPKKKGDLKPALIKLRKTNPNVAVYLRADQDVPHKYVREVMAECAAAEIIDIIFATFQPEGS